MEKQHENGNKERHLCSMNDDKSDSSPIDHDYIDSFDFPIQSFEYDQFIDPLSDLSQSYDFNSNAFPMFSSNPVSGDVENDDDPSINKNSNIHSNDNQKSNPTINFKSKSKNLKNTKSKNQNQPKKKQYHYYFETPEGARFRANYYNLFDGTVNKPFLKKFHLIAGQRNKLIIPYSRNGERVQTVYFNENAFQGDLIIETLRQLIAEGVIHLPQKKKLRRGKK